MAVAAGEGLGVVVDVPVCVAIGEGAEVGGGSVGSGDFVIVDVADGDDMAAGVSVGMRVALGVGASVGTDVAVAVGWNVALGDGVAVAVGGTRALAVGKSGVA